MFSNLAIVVGVCLPIVAIVVVGIGLPVSGWVADWQGRRDYRRLTERR